MKNFLLVVLGLICITLLIVGNQNWKERIAGAPASSAVEETANETALESDEDEGTQFESHISNWPEVAQEGFKQAVNTETSYKIALVGSPALGSGEEGWSDQLAGELTAAFEDQVEVSIFQEDTTSVQFTESGFYDDVLEFKPDLVLYEPFTLNDNTAGVPAEQSHESILTFYEDLQEKNENAVLLLQPSYPIDGATYYPKQVDKLKAFAEENDFTYLNHWTEWPEEAIDEYLLPSNEGPNDKGQELWADYLIDYFINDAS